MTNRTIINTGPLAFVLALLVGAGPAVADPTAEINSGFGTSLFVGTAPAALDDGPHDETDPALGAAAIAPAAGQETTQDAGADAESAAPQDAETPPAPETPDTE